MKFLGVQLTGFTADQLRAEPRCQLAQKAAINNSSCFLDEEVRPTDASIDRTYLYAAQFALFAVRIITASHQAASSYRCDPSLSPL